MIKNINPKIPTPICLCKPKVDLIIILNNRRMEALQLPSLQEIYDFSSSDLQKIAAGIDEKMALGALTRDQLQKYQDYLENIKIQLEERRTLEFFQELCAVDNPYIKKVTDFNNQFLKLASQAIAAQESHPKPFQKKPLHEISQEKEFGNDEVDCESVVSGIANRSRMTDNISYKGGNGYDEKAYTVISEKRSTADIEKRANVPTGKVKAKNHMKDFILSTLSKNKAEGCYVVKKSGPQKPQPAYTVNERGHLVTANTLEPISTKSIKSNSAAKQKVPTPATTSNKQIQSHNKVNEKQLQKKRLQAIEKVKNVKSQKKKERNFNNKDLLEMVREEEKEKQKKEKKKEMEKYQSDQAQHDSQKENKAKVQEKAVDVSPINQVSTTILKVQASLIKQEVKNAMKTEEKCEQIRQIIEVEEDTKEKNSQGSTEEIKEEIKHEQTQIELAIPRKEDSKKNIEIPELIKEQPAAKKTEPSIQRQQSPKETPKQHELRVQMDELAKMKAELQYQTTKKAQQKQQYLNLQKILEQQKQAIAKQKQNLSNNDFGIIIDVPEQSRPITPQSDPQQKINKKCYNEEYWIHIREQAESQIKRFKVDKELEELSKKSIKDNIEKSMSAKSDTNQSQPKSQGEPAESNPSQGEERASEASEEDAYIQKRKKQLARMISDHNKKTAPKRPTVPIIAPQKSIHPLPSFNYLQIYPTFNHIFSVMYTKAEHQALQDIPMIMKDLTNMFTTHQQHFKDKASYFKPAVFLPFDTSNNFQLSDPKQLLLHAENTYVNLKKLVERLEIFNGNLHGQFNETNNRYYRVVKTKEEVYDIISTGFLRRKEWKELPHGCSLRSSWNLFWSWSKPDIDISKLLIWQKINHFPFNKNLSRKDLLYKNLDSFRKMLRIPFNFLPLTYNLPKEFTQFSIKFHEEEIVNRDLNYWIMKPIGKSRGRGIKVINNLAELNYTDNIIVQKYIINPLLLDGYKFDMRIYVLVTNFHPLEAFVYKEGFARLSTEKFSLEPMFIKNTFVHLTNFAINRNNQDAKQTAAFSGGSKISLKVLKDKITKMGYSFNNVWAQVHQIIIKSLLGCSISVPPFPTAFELFGYDIMIDTDGGCHLIEINASPSLQRSYLIDQIVKQSLIDDILDIVDPPNFDKESLLDVMSERLAGKKKISPEEDLIAIARILNYKPVRKFGEMPENMGLFEMIAPSKLSTDLERQIKGRSGANNPKNID